jgi:hypothetical protein
MSTTKTTEESTKTTEGTKEATEGTEGATEGTETIGGIKLGENLLNESSAKLVMELVNVMVHKIIVQNQLIVNSQPEEFDKATKHSPFIEQQLQSRIELVNLIATANNELCKSLKEIFYTAGSTAFGIADKTFPIAVIIRLTQMVSKIVGTGAKLNDKIEETVNSISNSKEAENINKSFDQVEKTQQAAQQAADKAAHQAADKAQQAADKAHQAVDKAAHQAADKAADKAEIQSGGKKKLLNPFMTDGRLTYIKTGGRTPKQITNKKHIYSLKKKHLFNQKTLKIKNRLHKLFLI